MHREMYNNIAQLLFGANHDSDHKGISQQLCVAYDDIEKGFANGSLSLNKFYNNLFYRAITSAGHPKVHDYHDVIDAIAWSMDGNVFHEIELPYHNRAHTAKVGLNAAVLATMSNAANTTVPLTPTNIAQLLLAAVAHDFGHNGRGNTVDGQHVPFRLEQIAIDRAKVSVDPQSPIASRIDKTLALIYGTDVSGSVQPSEQVRDLHDYWFGGRPQGAPPHGQNLKLPLVTLSRSRERVLMAAILQDADVLASAIDPAVNRRESNWVAAEAGRDWTPAGGIYFIENILHGRMTTAPARKLADENIKAMLADFKAQVAAPARPVVAVMTDTLQPKGVA